jgi:phosphoesterase RecJ-like protein
MSEQDTIRAIGRALREAQRVLVVSHVRPDGDAVGSLLGLGLALEQASKEVQMVLADGVPSSFRGLEGARRVLRKPQGSFDLIALVDCADLTRVGGALEGLPPPDINIDHHVTNLNFAKLNLVAPEEVATSAILAEHLPGWGFELSRAVASALLTGIVSDTLGFRTSNMTPKALRLAAILMERGANLPELYNRALSRRSFQAARYWGEGLSRLQRDGRMVWTTLTLDDRQRADYSGNDDADLVNVLSAIDDHDIAVIFIEQNDNKVKVSWRSVPGYDVSKLAIKFGGGGHPAAAGAEIPGRLEDVQREVLNATRALLDGANGDPMRSENSAPH